MRPYLIGISGKIGSGKNYFADSIRAILEKHNYVVGEASFATALKAEGSAIIHDFLPILKFSEEEIQKSLDLLALKHNMTYFQIETLFSFVKNELIENPRLNGYSRSEGVRRVLQYLGTEIRRNTYENYWVEKFTEYLPENCDFIFVTDVRFYNEANCVLDLNGTLVRVEVSPDLIRERVIGRDGLLYSPEALNHPSETSLDDFPNFSIIVGDSYDSDLLAANIMARAASDDS